MMKTKDYISLTHKEQKKNKVIVGISGGVDSSVCAILLKEAGYEVEGVFAKVWQPDFVECTWKDEMRDAMRVCARLNIPFHFLDLEKEYKRYVGDYMIHEYQRGRTPNPDVMCNTYIKFGALYEYAMQKGFDFVATGHYARLVEGVLHRGVDTDKDQSYFLWNVTAHKFQNILFPLGELHKQDVRKIAKKHKLFTSEKKDSQGLCFIGPVDMKSFLKQLTVPKPGIVQNLRGETIGEHEGIQLYTVGERHGFTLYPQYKGSQDQAQYVISKNRESNTLIVAPRPQPVREVILSEPNFLNGKFEGICQVQFRYRQEPIQAFISRPDEEYHLKFEEKHQFIAEGQSAVIYSHDICLGGAIVEKVIY